MTYRILAVIPNLEAECECVHCQEAREFAVHIPVDSREAFDNRLFQPAASEAVH